VNYETISEDYVMHISLCLSTIAVPEFTNEGGGPENILTAWLLA
jgi:hypothetical protein